MSDIAKILVGQLRYQAKLFTRNPRALYVTFAFPLLLLVVRKAASAHLPADARAGVVGGVVAFGVVGTAFVTHASGLVSARERGTLKRLRGAPLPPWCYYTGRITATVVLAAVGAAVSVAGAVVMLGIDITVSGVVWVVVAVVFSGLCWSAMGTAMARFIPNPEAAQPMLMLVYLPLMFFSGTFFSLSDEPSWLSTVASWLPAAPAADAIGHALASSQVPVRDLLVLSGWAVVGLAVALAGPIGQTGQPWPRRTAS
ncbi:MAG TPA: ABC transporter permease [Pseudonocardiaceae bacterium]|jgi:ABC-type multidrug transport system permease subunit|nr:ABC transporter permease [Pseudonocardiaceae bacterium]